LEQETVWEGSRTESVGLTDGAGMLGFLMDHLTRVSGMGER